jgi:putative transposase
MLFRHFAWIQAFFRSLFNRAERRSKNVSGHDLSRAERSQKGSWALAPAMSKPSRPTNPENATGCPRTFFITTRTAGGRSLFQTERMANALIEFLRSTMRLKKIVFHDFVVMPNHLHILVTVPGEMTLEKAMRLIKGGFSYRAKKELGFQGEIWQRGYSDVRINDELSFQQHREYIENNPVKAGLVNSPEDYPYGSVYLKKLKHAGAKAQPFVEPLDGTTEVVP